MSRKIQLHRRQGRREGEKMLTKEQERKALEKIAAILAKLEEEDENSYVVTAFRGCADVAALNIEQDAAFSFMERMEAAEKRAKDVETLYIATEEARKNIAEENARLYEMAERVRGRLASEDVRAAVDAAVDAADAETAEAAEGLNRVTEAYADDGATLEAVRRYRAAKAAADNMRAAQIKYDEGRRDLVAFCLR